MLTKRTIGSLAQFLALFETDFVLVLCGKHGLGMTVEDNALLTTLNGNFSCTKKPESLLAIVEEIARTQGDLRARINPKYRFKERFEDRSCKLSVEYLAKAK